VVNPIQPIALNPPVDNGAAETARRQPGEGTQLHAQAPVPSEIVTLSELALHGTQPVSLRERRRTNAPALKSPGDAEASASRLRDLLVAIGPQAARAQAYANADRVWNLVRE